MDRSMRTNGTTVHTGGGSCISPPEARAVAGTRTAARTAPMAAIPLGDVMLIPDVSLYPMAREL
jgi:hypothetical protein